MSPDLPTYLTLALSYAGLGAVFGSLLPSLKHGIEHGSGRVSDIPQAAVSPLVPVDHLPGLIGNSDRYAATSAHVTPRFQRPDHDRWRVGSAERFEVENATSKGGIIPSNSDIGHAKRHVL